MKIFFWVLVLLSSIGAAHWGADQLAEPLQKLRKQWGLTEAAGAAFVALATASPEIGTNAASALRGVSEIGLGNLLGSNIVSVPAVVTVAYFAAQKHNNSSKSEGQSSFMSWSALQVKPEALNVQAIPYLAIIALAAILTLPERWRGLQPIDGWIMIAAYAVYLIHAIWRDRSPGERVRWTSQESWRAIAGVVLLVIGAYCTVTATENIVSLLGISRFIGGLFITSTLSIVPEVFATWSVAKSGQVTAATTSVIADNTATMTIAFFPLAMVTLPVQDLRLFSINLAFVALLAAVYIAFVYWGTPKHSFSWQEVLSLNVIYLIYVGVMLLGILNIFS